MLRPFLLRRLKSDVEKGLPPKKETILKIGMSEMRKKYYAALLQKASHPLLRQPHGHFPPVIAAPRYLVGQAAHSVKVFAAAWSARAERQSLRRTSRR